ncbi:hypothetical protein [uncultured Desulfovibrio sp.]|jgi:hypothetical protein|uniref:hypothetical protein n=1 Tax=uncultured Desulfovibrio sp. TaxID=167968 RepID=UPI0026DAB23A|nr:hypothetical protein [uncultured Desulfovibrio sp.]
MTSAPYLTPSDKAEEAVCTATDILRFLEETAGNYGTRLSTPACTGENGYSVAGWAGMSRILALAREHLEEAARRMPPEQS